MIFHSKKKPIENCGTNKSNFKRNPKSTAIIFNMRNTSIKSLERFSSPILITIVTLCFLVQARLDPDAHHDGIVFTAALANSTGLKPNLDFFSQYGPVPPIVQGFLLNLFGERLIVLRILTALMLSCIALLMLKSIQVDAGKRIAYLVVIYWVLAAPTYLIPTNMPWASVFTTLVGLIILKCSQKTKFSWIAIMSLVALGTLCRVQFLLVGVILIIGTILRDKRNGSREKEIYFAASVVLMVVILVMYILEILAPYVRENIIWSFLTYSPNPIGFDKKGLFKLIGLLLIPIFTFLFNQAYKRGLRGGFNKYESIYGFTLIAILLFLSLANSFHKLDLGRESFLNPFYVVKYITQLISFSGIFALVGFFTFTFIKKFHNLQSKPLTNDFLIQISVGMGALVQLYPQWDEMHIWWLSPIFAVLFFKFSIFKKKLAPPILALLIIFSGLQYLGNVSIERVKFKDKILAGMLGTTESVEGLGNTLETIESYFKTREYNFDCNVAIFASAGGIYLSESHSYVNWGPTSGNLNNQEPRGVFICNLSFEEVLKIRDLSKYGFSKITKSGANSWSLLLMNPD